MDPRRTGFQGCFRLFDIAISTPHGDNQILRQAFADGHGDAAAR